MSYRICETCGVRVPQWAHHCPKCGAARTTFRAAKVRGGAVWGRC